MNVIGDVLVVIGVGGMGQAIARRLGAGKTVLLADFNEDTLAAAADALTADGHNVASRVVDVSSRESVAVLAQQASALGRITQVAHTAGLSPDQAPAAAILAVDLVGVALVLEEFGAVIAAGGAGVVVSSMSGHMSPLPTEQEEALALTSADELLALPFISAEAITHSGIAYAIAKHGNLVRVRAASLLWGRRGARINSVSPGVISTPMGRQELSSPSGEFMRGLVEASGTGRLGTAEDIAAAAAFLLGGDSSFITGTDLLVDGGVIAALRSGAQVVAGHTG
jgi:NAD(P)-dependent dehydrogenase (short-subunit alcohol dehydrogenase family)